MTTETGLSGRACAHLEDRIGLLAGGDLPADEAAALNLHLPTCPGCRSALLELRDAMEWARGTDKPAFDEADLGALRGRIMGAIERTRPASGFRARLMPWLAPRFAPPGTRADAAWVTGLLGSLAAAAILVVVGLGSPGSSELGAGRPEGATGAGQVATAPAVEAAGSAEPVLLAEAEPAGHEPWPAFPETEAPVGRRPLKIELRTQDSKIKIIWLAQR